MQPVEMWIRLPAVPQLEPPASAGRLNSTQGMDLDRQVSLAALAADIDQRGSILEADHDERHAASTAAAESQHGVCRAVAAGFVATPSGPCCCLAVAEWQDSQPDQLRLHTLMQPVAAGAHAMSAWLSATVPLDGSEESSAWLQSREAPLHTPAGEA